MDLQLTHTIKGLDIRPEYRRALLTYENGELYVSCLSNYRFCLLIKFLKC